MSVSETPPPPLDTVEGFTKLDADIKDTTAGIFSKKPVGVLLVYREGLKGFKDLKPEDRLVQYDKANKLIRIRVRMNGVVYGRNVNVNGEIEDNINPTIGDKDIQVEVVKMSDFKWMDALT